MIDYDAVACIVDKRDGRELADGAIDWLVASYTSGLVADEQMAAFCMATFLNGMSRRELARFTDAMIRSGERIELSGLSRPTVDKHSTGGVGDKVSLVLAPLVAACGAAVPQLSGRGLGHTGGTLDKLESIAGWRAQLSTSEIRDQLERVGCVICAAGSGLAPADRKLYALRDVTGTIESIPLISASIMSKKIAEGTAALVLDVKVGSGAFMSSLDAARELAATMVALGRDHGVRASALLTRMDDLLGRSAGNALEVAEALEVLDGRGPADVVEVSLALAAEMLAAVGIDADPSAVLASGAARRVWDEMIAAQGGDPHAALPRAASIELLRAKRSGVVTHLDARRIGTAAWRLGAGRSRKEDAVSAVAGVVSRVGVGEEVAAGDVVLEMHADDPGRFERARAALGDAVVIGDSIAPSALVIERVV